MLSDRAFFLVKLVFHPASCLGGLPFCWSSKHRVFMISQTASKRARFSNFLLFLYLVFILLQLTRFYITHATENFNLVLFYGTASTTAWIAHSITALQENSARLLLNHFFFYLKYINSKFLRVHLCLIFKQTN